MHLKRKRRPPAVSVLRLEKSEGLPQTADNPSGKEKRECYRMVPRHMVFATVIMQYRKAMTSEPA